MSVTCANDRCFEKKQIVPRKPESGV